MQYVLVAFQYEEASIVTAFNYNLLFVISLSGRCTYLGCPGPSPYSTPLCTPLPIACKYNLEVQTITLSY